MKCVRCLRDTVYKVADAPDGSDAWEVYRCTTCNYIWRNTDPEYTTVVEKRDPWAQLDHLTDEQLSDMGALWEFYTFKENPNKSK